MPTLKALRVRLKSRLFLLPLKSFCKQKSFGDTPFFSAWFIYSFCHTDQALHFHLSFRPSVSAWRNLIIRSAVLYITGFLDFAINCSARNDSKNRAPEKILHKQKIFGKKEQSLCGLAVYRCKRLACFAYCDALGKAHKIFWLRLTLLVIVDLYNVYYKYGF